jgi:precorrin-6Y C5,15-methyltransferase (decarboxylating)
VVRGHDSVTAVPSSIPSHVTVVGIGAEGWSGLPPRPRALLEAAEVVVGSTRQLGLLPDVAGQERRAWPSPMSYDLLAGYQGREIVVVASGDPLLSGVATRLVELVGAERVDVVPAVSSVVLARARMRWSAEETEVLTLVGRPLERLVRLVSPGRRLLVLSADDTTPARVAALLTDLGHGASRLTVLGDLGDAGETRAEGTAAAWSAVSPRLNVLAIECDGPPLGGWTPGLPDDAYLHDGQLTKRDQRASALARLAPQPGQLLWDVGAGAGSVGIEWMRAHPHCRTVAVEADPERAARISHNAGRLGVPDLRVVTGRSPEALTDLPGPDACFIGGGASVEVLDLCRSRLRSGGRLVAHGVTLETERLLADAHAAHGGELVRLSVERAEPLGGYRGWSPARAVVQWSWEKP